MTAGPSLLRPVEIVPPEAYALAHSLRGVAARARSIADAQRRQQQRLDAVWEGDAKGRFFAEYSSDPGNWESLALWMEDQARRVERMTVTVWRA